MKVLHLLAGGRFGGAETIAVDTICALAEAGVEQAVIMRPHPELAGRLREAGIAVHPFRYSRTDLLIGRRAVIARHVARHRPDVVHAWLGRAASFIPPRLGIPTVGWFGGYYNLKRFRRCDWFVGMTADLVAHIVSSGAPAERVVEIHSFGELPPARPVARSDFTTPDDAFLLLAMARLHPSKALDILLDALSRVQGVYLWIAGEGPLRQELMERSRSIGVDERVRFLGWRTDRSALYAAADAVVLPSRYEPFGTVITEAWAMKRPLIASRASGAVQHVSDEVNGLLVDIDDTCGLAHAIHRLHADGALRERLVEGGQKTWQEGFSKARVTASWIELYETMTRNTATSGHNPV